MTIPGSSVPEDSRVALWLRARNEVRELSVDDSRRVLERDPELLHEYRKQRAMTRTRGRLIVTNQRRVAAILAWLDSA
jgi:hypothetical protein